MNKILKICKVMLLGTALAIMQSLILPSTVNAVPLTRPAFGTIDSVNAIDVEWNPTEAWKAILAGNLGIHVQVVFRMPVVCENYKSFTHYFNGQRVDGMSGNCAGNNTYKAGISSRVIVAYTSYCHLTNRWNPFGFNSCLRNNIGASHWKVVAERK